MKPVSAPIANITHTAFQVLLERQPWPFWAVDSNALEPLVAYQPVSVTKLLRTLKSYYIYSDLYLFNPASSEADIAAIDWRSIPHVDQATSLPYIVSRIAGQPFLGIAPSLDAARRSEITLLLPAHIEMPVHV